MPTVSIITPCYNIERYLGETVRSVIDQTFEDWELVLVDDGSTDTTAQVAAAFAAQSPKIKLIQQRNGGAAAARLTGYATVDPSSRFLFWLDGDDVIEPNFLQVLVGYLEAHTDVGLVICNRQHIDAESNPIMPNWRPIRMAPGPLLPRQVDDATPETPFASLFVQDAVSSPSAMVMRRDVYDRARGWDAHFGQPFDDWDVVFQVALLADVHYLPLALTRYRVGRPGQVTGSNAKRGRGLYLKLYDRWSRFEGVPRDKMHIVRDAVRFREGQALPHQYFVWGNDNVRRGKALAAAASYAQSLRYVGRFVLKTLNGTYRNHWRDAVSSGSNVRVPAVSAS